MPLDTALKQMLDAMAQNAGPAIEQMQPEEARAFFAQTSAAMPAPAHVELPRVEEAAAPGPAGEIPVRLYYPRAKDEGALPALVYFHGGGWVIGSRETHDATCRALARDAGALVASVEYRLAPEHPYPAAPEDCYAAAKWVAENAAALGAQPEKIAVGGDSAGGNLAAAVALMARARGGPRLCFQLLIYPVTDADFSRASYAENGEGYFLTVAGMHWFWNHYAPDAAQRREEFCAPLRAKSLAGLPPALVQTAEFDPLRDEGEAYARALQAAGVAAELRRYDGLIHGYFAMGAITPAAAAAVSDAASALRRAFGN